MHTFSSGIIVYRLCGRMHASTLRLMVHRFSMFVGTVRHYPRRSSVVLPSAPLYCILPIKPWLC